jgi:hypothetical protein
VRRLGERGGRIEPVLFMLVPTGGISGDPRRGRHSFTESLSGRDIGARTVQEAKFSERAQNNIIIKENYDSIRATIEVDR